MRSLVAFVVPDAIGERMAGPAIRAVELARQVRSVADVRLVARARPTDPPDDLEVVVAADDPRDVERAVRGAQVLVTFGGILTQHPWLADGDLHIVADAYDPAPLEALVQTRSDPMPARRAQHAAAQQILSDQLRRADLVLCASDRQRHLLLGMLAALGRVNPLTFDADPTLQRLVRVLPFGTPTEPLAERRPGALRGGGKVPDGAFVLCWGGGVYEWLDPELLVEAVAACDDPSLVAYFMGVRHPTPAVPAMPVAARLTARAEALGLLGSQILLGDGWVPYAARGRHLVDADVGVTLHHDHVETTFAYRTRALDYLWAGLPVLCSAGDEVGDLVAARDLGETVAPGDLDGLVAAIGRLRDPARRAACGDRSSAVAREHTWDTLARPLIEYCAAPWRAPDLAAPPHAPAPPAGWRRAAGAARRAVGARRRPPSPRG